MLLYLIRHADPIYNPDSLTPLGHRQAEAIGKRLALHGIDRVFSSTSNRAILTATPASEMTKKPIEQLDFAHEAHAHRALAVPNDNGHRYWFFGIPKYRALLLSPAVLSLGDKWYEHETFAPFHFEDGLARIDRESDAWLASLGYEHDRENHCYRITDRTHVGSRIALFAHWGFGLSFLSSILDIPYPLFVTHFDLTHSGMTVIDFPEELPALSIPRVLVHSGEGHLYSDGLPTRYNGGIYI